MLAAVDAKAVLASMSKAEKNIRFGLARGLTNVAREASVSVNQAMAVRFDRPTPFTQNAAAFLSANRETLTSTVLIKNIQAEYLRLEETGGRREPEPGKPINVPVDQRTNVYGNIPRGTIARLKARKDTFVATGKDSATSHLPPGIYQRNKGGRLKFLIGFERRAEYQPRFHFRETVIAFAQRSGLATLAKSVADAIATAK